MADSQTLRDRYVAAVRASAFPGLTVQGAVDAALAVRDDELAALRREVAYVTETGETWRLLWEQGNQERCDALVRTEEAEAAVVRVRSLHRAVKHASETICDACSPRAGDGPRRYFVEPFPCPTIRALDVPADGETEGTDGR